MSRAGKEIEDHHAVNADDDDGFITVGKKGKKIESSSRKAPASPAHRERLVDVPFVTLFTGRTVNAVQRQPQLQPQRQQQSQQQQQPQEQRPWQGWGQGRGSTANMEAFVQAMGRNSLVDNTTSINKPSMYKTVLNGNCAPFVPMQQLLQKQPLHYEEQKQQQQLPTGSEKPHFVVLCGFPGSGKSWFSTRLAASRDWTRVNQDELRNRKACERVVENVLEHNRRRRLGSEAGPQMNIVIDRCNPTPENRNHWLELAGYPSNAIAIYFSANAAECNRRINERHDHPTIKPNDPSNKKILDFFKSELVPPSPSERFADIFKVATVEDSRELLAALFGVVAT